MKKINPFIRAWISVVLAVSFHCFIFCVIFCGCLFRRALSVSKNLLCGHSEASACLSDLFFHHSCPYALPPQVPLLLEGTKPSPDSGPVLPPGWKARPLRGELLLLLHSWCRHHFLRGHLLAHTAGGCLTPALPTVSLYSYSPQRTCLYL